MLFMRVYDNGKIHGVHGILHRTDYAFTMKLKCWKAAQALTL
jgi:hypothetical protein